MKKLIVTVIATTFAVGLAYAQSPAEQSFAQRFAEMQLQSGAKFPTAPPYKGASIVAAGSAAPATKAAGDRKHVEFADRITEMQKLSGAKFVTAPAYKSPSMTALAEKESSKGTKVQ